VNSRCASCEIHFYKTPYVSGDNSFDSLLIVSEEAGFTYEGSTPFDHQAVLAYNVVIWTTKRQGYQGESSKLV
jgi:hypothetical protein